MTLTSVNVQQDSGETIFHFYVFESDSGELVPLPETIEGTKAQKAGTQKVQRYKAEERDIVKRLVYLS